VEFQSLLILGVISVFALALNWMIRTERRKRCDRQQIAAALGFTPIEELDDVTVSQLIRFHQHTHTQELIVRHAAERIEAGTRWLLFDLVDHSGDSNSTLVDAGVAVISEKLQLPRFSLFPRLGEKGRLNDFANHFLEMLIEKRRNRIRLATNAHFEERYFLLGDDEPAITEFLDDYRLSRLGQATYRHLEAAGDCFSYSRFVFATRGKRDIAEARVLLELFSS
jgi:hypothetical protein